METHLVNIQVDFVRIDWLELVRDHWGTLAIVGVVLLVLLLVARAILARRRTQPRRADELAIDVSALPDAPPPPGPPVLEFYNLPVRLSAVVLAPVGRASELPAREQLPDVVDSILPGLDQVVTVHRPLLKAWPRQVSSRGFAHAFFQNVQLPGKPGKKSFWSAVAGIIRVGETPMMAGLVLRAETANRHGNYIMETEDQWLGVLRVRLS